MLSESVELVWCVTHCNGIWYEFYLISLFVFKIPLSTKKYPSQSFAVFISLFIYLYRESDE